MPPGSSAPRVLSYSKYGHVALSCHPGRLASRYLDLPPGSSAQRVLSYSKYGHVALSCRLGHLVSRYRRRTARPALDTFFQMEFWLLSPLVATCPILHPRSH